MGVASFSLRYLPGQPFCLKHLSVTIPAYSEVGVVGRSGSGKSTLLAATLRLIEAASGDIFICGVPTATVPLSKLRSRVTMVPQEPLLYEGKIRENLDPASALGDDTMWRLLQQCKLDGLVRALPGQLDAIYGVDFHLSVGERQLVCLARAMSKPSPLRLLDEVTSALDATSEQTVMHVLQGSRTEVTTIAVAHRLLTIADYDALVVLKAGELIETGHPRTMSRSGGIFASMCAAQQLGL